MDFHGVHGLAPFSLSLEWTFLDTMSTYSATVAVAFEALALESLALAAVLTIAAVLALEALRPCP